MLTNVCAAIRFQRGDLPGAAAHFAEAADVFHSIGERRQEVATRMNYGASRQRLGHLRDAAREYVSALSIARDLGDQRVEAYALANLASVRRELGRYQDAERYARAACAIFHRIGDWQGEADGLNELGLILVNSGQAADAVGAHRAALTLVAHRDRRRAAGCLRELGESLAAKGDIAQAKSTLREAVRALVEVGAAEAQTARQSLAALERSTTDGLPRTATPITSNPHSA